MNTDTTPATVRGSDSSEGLGGAAEKCPDCGTEVSCTLGPDYRFNPPLSRPQMWTACCGGGCFDLSKSWTAFTRERALELWNQGIRATGAKVPLNVGANRAAEGGPVERPVMPL